MSNPKANYPIIATPEETLVVQAVIDQLPRGARATAQTVYHYWVCNPNAAQTKAFEVTSLLPAVDFWRYLWLQGRYVKSVDPKKSKAGRARWEKHPISN